MRFLSALLALALPAFAQPVFVQPVLAQDVAGRFDYYLLSLSWSPSWCDAQGRAQRSEQCEPARKLGFTVHGLWPQYENGWPEDCTTRARDPSRRESRDMADIMGTSGLAWYQWKKHGRCSGLSAQDYFALTRQATQAVAIPEILTRVGRDVTLPAKVIEDAFLEANPDMTRDGITVTCRDRALQEVRICLTRDLQPRACAPDAARDCRGTMLLPAPE
ncbi:ribonuclease T2 family protein [Paracoccus shanxieyensis]|uniref:Ribonuclease T n=1 Tax=Paracoccus shanxieyensis TaxID=2675752 RepID=A0A6L6IQJ6_9RHOB|nr:ribonuclease T2 [Paracoccus shanxieyensis]MTH62756.1 ribonuclease T [Paracoccus shanxieyensis]MTH86160.1 ribonuclease T [Paracoccus shanxieyensis]